MYEELIKAARAEANCKQCEGCGSCLMPYKENQSHQRMCVDFAEEVLPQLCDALEAADKRVKELEEKNKALKKELKEQEDIWNHPEKLGEMLAGL